MCNDEGTYLQHIKHNMSLLDDLLSFIVPHLCLGCQVEGSLLCGHCRRLLAATERYYLKNSQVNVLAVTSYEGLAKVLVWRLKAGGAQAAARVMAECMAPLVQATPASVLVPIPTATSHIRERGYDQVRLITRELSRVTQVPYRRYLRRSGQVHQIGANRTTRLLQLQHALQASTVLDGQKRYILVDDVVTTGATLDVAARALQQAGARHIEAVTFAQTKNKPKTMP